MTTLFSAFNLKGKAVKNRIVFPPLVCFVKQHENGFVTDINIEHYRRHAKGGSGIVIVEATCISPYGKLAECQLGAWDDKFIGGLSKLAAVIHENDALALIQIHHAGLRTSPASCNNPIAPSDYENKGKKAHAMTEDEIKQTQDEYVNAALRAQKAGFDGIELHGCHSYLISQFMSPKVNLRTDKYGERKELFGVEILQAIRKAAGDDFIIGVRTSGNDPDMAASIEYAKAFEKAGADYLHVSTGYTGAKPSDFEFDNEKPYNWIVQMGVEIKRHVSIPVIAVNGIRTPGQAKALIENDLVDFAAIGKGQFVDADWANKVKNNEPVDECLGCDKCLRFTNMDACVKTGSNQ